MNLPYPLLHVEWEKAHISMEKKFKRENELYLCPFSVSNFQWAPIPHYGKSNYLVWPELTQWLHCECAITCISTPFHIKYPKLSYIGLLFTLTSAYNVPLLSSAWTPTRVQCQDHTFEKLSPTSQGRRSCFLLGAPVLQLMVRSHQKRLYAGWSLPLP